MKLRTLKKWSKKAVPLLKHYGPHVPEIFLAERGQNYHGLKIHCNHPVSARNIFGKCDCLYHPLKGTPMVGETRGYYEPEWHEETAWGYLHELVLWGERPKTMTDAEWKATLKLTRLSAADIDAHMAWVQEGIEGAAAL